jgi:biopolymer transport protein ExbD
LRSFSHAGSAAIASTDAVRDEHLPDPSARATAATTSIVLEVYPNDAYAINTQKVSRADLAERLRRIYDGRPTRTIIVRGAPGVRYQDVVTAVDIARGAGVSAIGLASRPK